VLEQLDGIGDDPAAAAGEAHDALERRERARCGLCRAALSAQRIEQSGDVVDGERRDPPPRERRQQVAVELVAVRLKRARVTLAGGDLGLEALKPSAGDGLEGKPRRTGTLPSRVVAISARRSRRASASSKPTVLKRSLPAWRQQTAYLPFGWR
jgi:hypothetical protein